MKLISTVLLFLFLGSAQAQDLPSRPVSQWTNDPQSPITYGLLVRERIDANSYIPEGMVWYRDRGAWFARDQGSCGMCGKPMTFRQAVFDKKATAMWGLAISLQIVNARLNNICLRKGACGEGIPFLGRASFILGSGSFNKQMSIKVPLTVLSWVLTAKTRSGNRALHVGGWKDWWIVPVINQAASTTAIIANSRFR